MLPFPYAAANKFVGKQSRNFRMAGSAATDDSAASTAGMRDDERSLSSESLSEWRSCDRADSDSPSTSPPFWDTDSDDDDPGA
jgi:hypothetical protein